MSRFIKLSTLAKSAAVALALGGATLAAVPAQAAPPSIDFHFGLGGGGIAPRVGGDQVQPQRRTDGGERRHGDGHGLEDSAHASSITARASRRQGTAVPARRDTTRGPVTGPLSLWAGLPGRRVFCHAATGGSPPKPD